MTHTETLDSDWWEAWPWTGAELKECAPCRPIMLAWLPAEAANAEENCCANSLLQPASSAEDLWAGAEAKLL